MVLQNALYYPYISVRDDTWLKAAALYWGHISRIIPDDHSSEDSPTAQVFEGSGLLRTVRPRRSAERISRMMEQLIDMRGDELRHEFGFSGELAAPGTSPQRTSRGPGDLEPLDGPSLAFIHRGKLSSGLVGRLHEAGLTYAHHSRGPQWVAMDGRLAAAYMTVLARDLGSQRDLQPVTDSSTAYGAYEAGGLVEIVDAILDGTGVDRSPRVRSDREVRVMQLAIQSVLPRRLQFITPEDIVTFRNHHMDLLLDFQSSVAMAVDAMSSVPITVDEDVLRDRLNEVVQQYVIEPQQRLASAYQISGWLAGPGGTLIAQVPGWISALGGSDPHVGVAAQSLATGGSMVCHLVNRRASAGRQRPGTNYLLRLQRELGN